MAMLNDAFDAYEEGQYQIALLLYEDAALMGLEIAQSNAAYIYDHVRASLPPLSSLTSRWLADSVEGSGAQRHRHVVACTLVLRAGGRAAPPLGVPPHRRLLLLRPRRDEEGAGGGGIGLSERLIAEQDLAKAVHYYQVANELGSAHAAWNLGYMYQWGEVRCSLLFLPSFAVLCFYYFGSRPSRS